MRWKVVFGNIGSILLFFAIALMLPIIPALYFWDGPYLYGTVPIHVFAFLGTGAFSFLLGTAFRRWGRKENFFPTEALVIVSLSWLFIPLIGAIPFVLTGVLTSPADAFFESMSGFTTTGATVLPNALETYPKSILFWRSLNQWIGGMGFIVLAVAVLTSLTKGGSQLMAAEAPGPSLKRLKPKVMHTAKILWTIYMVLSASLFILLIVWGMGAFDAINHTMTTMSTGGFSTRSDSIGAWGSPVRWIIIFFMLSAATNFTLIYATFQRRLRSLLFNAEYLLFISIFGISSFVVGALLVHHGSSVGDAMEPAAFQAASIVTTTGFTTADFGQWPRLAQFILLILMFVGGCSGSTSGGIKSIRLLIVLKAVKRKLHSYLAPRRVMSIRIGKEVLEEEAVNGIMIFFILYILIFVLSAGIAVALGMDLVSGSSASAASLGNIGPGLGEVGPSGTFAEIHSFTKVWFSLCMWFGRLEIFTALVLFNPELYRGRDIKTAIKWRAPRRTSRGRTAVRSSRSRQD